jgi:hypothetical protein
MFKLSFNTENDAFQDGNKEEEIKRILQKVIKQVEEIPTTQSYDNYIYDINSNKIGQWELIEE